MIAKKPEKLYQCPEGGLRYEGEQITKQSAKQQRTVYVVGMK